MATTKDLHRNRLVSTPYGTAIIDTVYRETGTVCVLLIKESIEKIVKTTEISLTANMRIVPETKSNYLNLNGCSLNVIEYLPNKTHTGRITCSVIHPDLLKVVNVDFNENEVKIVEKREDGYYWVKSKNDSDWRIAQYFCATKQFSYTDGKHNYESEMYLIDESPIHRKH